MKRRMMCLSVDLMWLRKIVRFSFAVMILSVLTGCFAIHKSYIDLEYGKTNFQDISRRAQPLKWRVVAEFQRNGTHIPKVDRKLQNQVERVLKTSGMVDPVADNNAPKLEIVVNNLTSSGGAAVAAKDFLSGFTLGLIGTSETDTYEMNIVLSKGNVVITKTGYKHALHTTKGLIVSQPPGTARTSANAGFNNIIEQMMLTALKDFELDAQALSLSSLGFAPFIVSQSLWLDVLD
ncbi:MAG: hypothetical protein A2X58_06485 [Nitrospirae bacterium GWC2_56_14]|nr:MAG: hypothetical protein A2X58_06485 [Nitrospirae bacterium GWC2_56_14]